jgi:hypothetical protein
MANLLNHTNPEVVWRNVVPSNSRFEHVIYNQLVKSSQRCKLSEFWQLLFEHRSARATMGPLEVAEMHYT